MASKIGMNHRNEAAQQRIDEVITGLVDVLDIAVQPIPDQIRDRTYRETLRLEWTADALAAVLGALTGDDQAIEAEAFSLATVSRTQLEMFAIAIGIEDADDQGAFPENEDLLAAIDALLPVSFIVLIHLVIDLFAFDNGDEETEAADGEQEESDSDDSSGEEGKGTPDQGDTPEPIDLKGLKRVDLNRIAAELGIDAPEHLPNIAAVIEAIEAKYAELTGQGA